MSATVEPVPDGGGLPDQGELDTISAIFSEAIIAFIIVLMIAGVLSFVLLRAASKRADAMVTISLSLLTLVSIIGFIASRAETLGTLAGAGIGALAGALTNLFQGERREEENGPDNTGTFSPPPDTLRPPDEPEG